MYHVYWCTGWYTGTDGTLIFGLFSFLPPRPLQQLNPHKSSGIPPAANVDFVGIFQIVGSLVLLQVGGQAFLCQRIQGIIFAPLLVHIVDGFGTDLRICFQPEVALGFHKLHDIVSVSHSRFHIGTGAVADGELEVIANQPPQSFQRP